MFRSNAYDQSTERLARRQRARELGAATIAAIGKPETILRYLDNIGFVLARIRKLEAKPDSVGTDSLKQSLMKSAGDQLLQGASILTDSQIASEGCTELAKLIAENYAGPVEPVIQELTALKQKIQGV